MKEIVADTNLVAYCGLYCGACRSHLRGTCPGCRKNDKATWCGVRTCCLNASYASCADCATFPDPQGCKKFNNFIAKAFGLLFRSDRRACIAQIRALGLPGHAEDMARNKRHTIRR
jgi:hypothetical protein